MELNGRELATLIWLALIVAALLSNSDMRKGLVDVLRAAAAWKIWLSLLTFVGYAGALLAVPHALGLWSGGLIKVAIVWFFTTALALFFKLDRAMSDRRFFRRVILASIGFSMLLQFVADLHPFSVWVEVPLQGLLALVALLSVAAERDKSTHVVARSCQGILEISGLTILGASLVKLTQRWGEVDWRDHALEFAFPIWASIAIVPFLYLFALLAAYEGQWMRMGFVESVGGERKHRLGAFLALGTAAHVRLRRVVDLSHQGRREMVLASTLRARVHAFREDRRRRADELEAEARAKRSLEANSGQPGADAEGRRVDQREFEQTKDALRHLAFCQMGWHNSTGHYRQDLMTVMDFESQGLPSQHGVDMTVSLSGQRWWAWRQTPCGWFLGIGANRATPDQWFYEGEAPPIVGPAEEPGWRDQLDPERQPNWD